MEIVLIHFLLGIVLFFIINWIGKHSYSIGYMEISMFVKTEEAPALNFLIRVLTPTVYIIIIAAILYALKLDKYVVNIYLINIYYIVFRLIFNLITERGLLLNWYRQALYWTAIILISFIVYEKLIKIKANILPDFSTIANELWIIILIFIFQITNSIRFSNDKTIKRKYSYIKSKYYKFFSQYGSLVKELTKNESLEALTYSIMLYEDFNRPRIVRKIENIVFRLTKKKRTLGIMQVQSENLLTDKESVILGTNKIMIACRRYLESIDYRENSYYEYDAIHKIISHYNGGEKYTKEVSSLYYMIKEKFYKSTNDTLMLNKNGL